MTAPHTITIQPGQPGEDMDYNVHKPLPYPFHINTENGDCVHGRGTDEFDLPKGRMPWRLIGFQILRDVQELDHTLEEFIEHPEAIAIGHYPVFIHEGDIFSLDVPITSVRAIGKAVSA